MKHPADLLTGVRIALTGVLCFLQVCTPGFLIVYTLCGISDMLDGFVARRTHTSSQRGARFDSIADVLFFIVIAVKLVPILPLTGWMVFPILMIITLMVLTLLVTKKRFSHAFWFHTYGEKATGFLLFLMPYFLNKLSFLVIFWLICAIALLSAGEELALSLTQRVYDPNCKGLWFKAPAT